MLAQRQKILLSVDLSYQVHRCMHAYSKLTCNDTFTGGLYGFMELVCIAILKTRATHVVITQDRKPYLRSVTYPAYKQLRKKGKEWTEEEIIMFNQSMKLILELCDVVGFPVWGIDGFEADDMTAHAVNKYRHRWDKIFAMSNDSDLYQLFDHEAFYVYSKGMEDLMNKRMLQEKLGLTPQEFTLASALQGTHNSVEGIVGIGPAKAAQAVKDVAKLSALMKQHGPLIERNQALIKLPHPEFPYAERLPGLTGNFSAQRLYRFCSRYDIHAQLKWVDAFEQVHKQ